jgi:hypothetical protein
MKGNRHTTTPVWSLELSVRSLLNHDHPAQLAERSDHFPAGDPWQRWHDPNRRQLLRQLGGQSGRGEAGVEWPRRPVGWCLSRCSRRAAGLGRWSELGCPLDCQASVLVSEDGIVPFIAARSLVIGRANHREASLPDDQVEALVFAEILEVLDVEGRERQAVGQRACSNRRVIRWPSSPSPDRGRRDPPP